MRNLEDGQPDIQETPDKSGQVEKPITNEIVGKISRAFQIHLDKSTQAQKSIAVFAPELATSLETIVLGYKLRQVIAVIVLYEKIEAAGGELNIDQVDPDLDLVRFSMIARDLSALTPNEIIDHEEYGPKLHYLSNRNSQ